MLFHMSMILRRLSPDGMSRESCGDVGMLG
jgi:hypothetical protein